MNISPPLPASPTTKRLSRTSRKGLVAGLLVMLALAPLAATAQERAEPPRVEAQKIDGSPYSLSNSRGVVTVVSVWSPESIASRKCIGELQRFATMYQQRGVEVIAISTSGDADQLQRFADQRQLTMPMAILRDTNLGPFNNRELPLLYVFDRDGKLQATRWGLYRLRVLEQLVAPLL